MNAFIVDDETISRNTLKFMLEKHCPDIIIIGEADNYTSAVLDIQRMQPDILFLDINLGNGKSGFNVLDALKSYNGAIIFITAYQDFALKAFQYANVAHYILKPIDPIDLVEAINRALKKSSSDSENTVVHTDNKDYKISLPYKNGLEMVSVNEIIYLEGDGSYCKIHLESRKIITISKNMKFVLGKLTDYPEFIRVHKSYVVNKAHINMYIRTNGGQLELSTKEMIPVSLTYKHDVLSIFN